jgi:hypothetical protein
MESPAAVYVDKDAQLVPTREKCIGTGSACPIHISSAHFPCLHDYY